MLQPALGYLSKFTYPADLLSLAATGESLGEFNELQERLPELQKKFPGMGVPSELDEEKYMEALRTAQETFPTQRNFETLVEEKTGAPLTEKNTLQKMLRLGGMAGGFTPGTAGQKAISATAAPLVSQGAQAVGVPESLSDILGLGLSPLRLKSGAVKEAGEKLRAPPLKETMKSGLEKPRAIESKNVAKGKISPQQQTEAIQNLNKQAEHLTKKKFEEHFPIAKQLEEGFDFQGEFNKEYGDLESIAKKYNPTMDIEPISQFLEETFEKYHGIASPHKDAKRILHEASKISENLNAGLHSLLKNRKSNNAKLGEIYGQSLMKGKRPEYSTWLRELNKKIDASIKKTLPENSSFIKRMDDVNAKYSQHKKALEAKSLLEPILGGKLSGQRLKSLIENPKIQRKLELATNKKTAEELTQIAKDLKTATDAIKKIPQKDISKLESVYSTAAVLSGGLFGKVHALAKGKDAAQQVFGYMLLNPKSRKSYSEVLKALAKGDPKSYEQALKNLAKSLRGDLV